MKRTVMLFLAIVLSLGLMACSGGGGTTSPGPSTTPSEPPSTAASTPPETAPATEPAASTPTSAEKVDLVVFAAASMTETMEEIATLYKEVAPNVNITYNFDSSGTLKTQIQEGAECDLFISAGQKQMNELDITADAEVNTEGLDFVVESSRTNILENKVTLCVPVDNPKDIKSFDELAEHLKSGDIMFAMGNSDVPVGQYTQKILEYYELDEEAIANAGSITYGTNVKEVTTQIREASVDCGVVYCTDAFSAGLDIVDYATADMCGQVIYPAAVLKPSESQEAAQAFLDYLVTPEAMAVFEKVGFSAVK